MTQATRSSTQVRAFTFDLAGRASDDAIPVVVSTDSVVEVEDGPEVLTHTREAVDLSRAPLPIIATHKRGQVNVGIIDDLQIAGGKMRGMARFGSRQEAAEYKADVLAGIVRSVSVGYARIKAHFRNDGVLVTTRWMPSHAALVAEPADIGAGFFRAIGVPAFELAAPTPQPPAAPSALKERATMADTTAAGAVAADPTTTTAQQTTVQTTQVTRQSPVEIERERRQAVQDLCRANRIDPRTEERWITDGTPLPKIATELLNVLEERGKAKPQSAADLGLSRGDQQRYSLFRVMRAISAQNASDSQRFSAEAAYELECSRSVAKQLGRDPDGIFVPADILRKPLDQAVMQRAMTAVPGTAGGFMVQTDNMGFIDILRNRSVLSRMGARTLSGLQGNVAIPRQTGSATLTWQAGETATATATDQTLGQLSMTPKTAIAVTELGRTLMMQSSPSAESMITADLAKVVALGVDLAGISGTGGAQPIGIINTTGITTGQDASTATYAKILAFQSVAAGSNAILGGAGYVTTPAVAAALMARSRFANTDTPLWDGNILDGAMAGFKAMSSVQMTTSYLLFGSFEEVVIGEWGVLELTMNPYQSFSAGVVGIRAIYSVDVLTRYPQAFVLSTAAS